MHVIKKYKIILESCSRKCLKRIFSLPGILNKNTWKIKEFSGNF